MRIRTGFVALVVLAAAMPAARAAEGFEGFYAGFTLGARTQKANWYTTEIRYRDNTRVDPTTGADGLIPNGTAISGFLSDTTANFSDKAYGVGLILGYNWQFENNLVVGVEASAGSAPTYDRNEGVFPGLGTGAFDPTTYAAVRTSKPLALGLTAGYVIVPGTLAYVRANYERLAVTGVGSSTICPSSNLNYDPDGDPLTDPPETAPIACDRGGLAVLSDSSRKLYGWGFGLGVEHKFGDTFALRLEYRRAEYGRGNVTGILDESPDNFGADALIDLQRTNIVELGVLFHF